MFKKFFVTSIFCLPLFIISCSAEKPGTVLVAQEETRTLTSVKFTGKLIDANEKGVSGISVQVKTGYYEDSDTTSSSGYFSLRSKFDKNEVVYFHFSSTQNGIDSYVPCGNIPKGLDPVKIIFHLDQRNQVHLGSFEY